MTLTPTCQFCGVGLIVEVPAPTSGTTEAERAAIALGATLRRCAARVACNRCADYWRAQNGRLDMIRKAGFLLGHVTGKELEDCHEAIRRLAVAILGNAAAHYRVTVSDAWSKRLVQLVTEGPEFARSWAEKAEAKVKEQAKK